MLLVRPYPVPRLAEARVAMEAAARGDVAPLQALYRAAADALAAIDPDEVQDLRDDHRRAIQDRKLLARAAVELADTWEGTVAVGSVLPLKMFRGFAWLSAQVRYELGGPADAARLDAYTRGLGLPETDADDAALFVALPALLGLGPELPDEIDGELPFPGDAVHALLGLPADADYEGLDPLDGVAISPETCRSFYPAAPAAWRAALGRGLESGLLVRPALDDEAIDP